MKEIRTSNVSEGLGAGEEDLEALAVGAEGSGVRVDGHECDLCAFHLPVAVMLLLQVGLEGQGPDGVGLISEQQRPLHNAAHSGFSLK